MGAERDDAAILRAVFAAIAGAPDRSLETRAIAAIEGAPHVFPGDLLARLVLELAGRHGRAAWLSALWRIAVERLLTRSEAPVPPPTNWAQVPKGTCNCRDCAELGELLRSPTEETGRFRMAEHRRVHLEAQLRAQDVTCQTVRTGSPHTLVVTKTRRTHEERLAQRVTDLALVARLAALDVPARSEALLARARAVAV